MLQRSKLTSKLIDVLFRLRLNEQTSNESSVNLLLLTLEEFNPHHPRSRIDKIWHSLKLTSIVYPWKWVDNLEELKRHRKGGRFGSIKWREETKKDGIMIVRFYNLIMVDSDYCKSGEYQHTFQLRLVKQSSELSNLFLLQLKLSCRRIRVHSFREDLVEEILEVVGYLSNKNNRRDLTEDKVYKIVPSGAFLHYQKLSLSTFPAPFGDLIQIIVLIVAVLAIPAIDLASKSYNISSIALRIYIRTVFQLIRQESRAAPMSGQRREECRYNLDCYSFHDYNNK